MADTDEPSNRDVSGRFQVSNTASRGRRPKRLTEDVEGYLIDALNIQGARMLVECMTSATKLCGQDAVEHPDWSQRVGAFETIRDTVLGRPAQVITGEDGAPLIGSLGTELVTQLANLKR